MDELNSVLKKIRKRSSPGKDNVSNFMLLNLPESFLGTILKLFNLAISEHSIPFSWKNALITMIAKKDCPKHEINSYRPISKTSSLGKVLERLIGMRLTKFLDDHYSS